MRETAAQALGAATRPLPPAALGALLSSLRQLSECSEWEVRHGGLLGLKYVLAARGGAAAGDGGSGSGSQAGADLELLQAVLPAALVGLRVSFLCSVVCASTSSCHIVVVAAREGKGVADGGKHTGMLAALTVRPCCQPAAAVCTC